MEIFTVVIYSAYSQSWIRHVHWICARIVRISSEIFTFFLEWGNHDTQLHWVYLHQHHYGLVRYWLWRLSIESWHAYRLIFVLGLVVGDTISLSINWIYSIFGGMINVHDQCREYSVGTVDWPSSWFLWRFPCPSIHSLHIRLRFAPPCPRVSIDTSVQCLGSRSRDNHSGANEFRLIARVSLAAGREKRQIFHNYHRSSFRIQIYCAECNRSWTSTRLWPFLSGRCSFPELLWTSNALSDLRWWRFLWVRPRWMAWMQWHGRVPGMLLFPLVTAEASSGWRCSGWSKRWLLQRATWIAVVQKKLFLSSETQRRVPSCYGADEASLRYSAVCIISNTTRMQPNLL